MNRRPGCFRASSRRKAALRHCSKESLPLLGDKSDTTILTLAENVVGAISAQTPTDPRIRLGQAGLRRVFAKLYLQLANVQAAREQAIEARKLIQLQCDVAPTDTACYARSTIITSLSGNVIWEEAEEDKRRGTGSKR